MTLTMPTPEELEAEAADLERRADVNERLRLNDCCSQRTVELLTRDAAIFREEAASKRAKAERMRKQSAALAILIPECLKTESTPYTPDPAGCS